MASSANIEQCNLTGGSLKSYFVFFSFLKCEEYKLYPENLVLKALFNSSVVYTFPMVDSASLLVNRYSW